MLDRLGGVRDCGIRRLRDGNALIARPGHHVEQPHSKVVRDQAVGIDRNYETISRNRKRRLVRLAAYEHLAGRVRHLTERAPDQR